VLRDSQAFSGFSVDESEKAHAFYARTLGLDVGEAGGMLTLNLAGGRVLVQGADGSAGRSSGPCAVGAAHRRGLLVGPLRQRPTTPTGARLASARAA